MTVRIIKGDAREKLAELPADSFNCIVTSPPYYGLRDYGCPGQIGLEPTLDAYLETMVAVCRELRRVLKPSGVFFLNIGDSYATGGHGGNPNMYVQQPSHAKGRSKPPAGLKPKDLCLVPERLGIALQADGWWVRSHIIWHKLNPMPESVTDRPTSAHETIWMLTKAERYFWDAEAVAEKTKYPIPEDRQISGRYQNASGRNDGGEHRSGGFVSDAMRNLRNVWSVASEPFPGAHFATMPPEIVERCIKAGSSEKGCCAECGSPWVRIVERESPPEYQGGKAAALRATGVSNNRTAGGPSGNGLGAQPTITLGWQPSCKCPAAELVPARILDPFAGAGTTGLVVDRLWSPDQPRASRDCTLIDLNTSYAEMAMNRIKDDAPLFAKVAAE